MSPLQASVWSFLVGHRNDPTLALEYGGRKHKWTALLPPTNPKIAQSLLSACPVFRIAGVQRIHVGLNSRDCSGKR